MRISLSKTKGGLFIQIAVMFLCFTTGIVEADAGLKLKSTVLQDYQLNYPLNLEYLFAPADVKADGLAETEPVERESFGSLYLMGTMIIGDKKIAWIKLQDNSVHELSLGQRLPGSSLRIGRISPGSVEIENADACGSSHVCEVEHVLEIY